jgi:hypothetical protein
MYARADLLITKVHGLETLFPGTAVVYAPAEVDQFAADINQPDELEVHILLILLTLDKKSCGITNGYFEAGTGAEPLHCRANGQSAPEAATTSAFSYTGCKFLACS